ncbi:permease prefix domain 1-containing protein [Clostridium sp.]|uniref:permease prefix domain 1-containing protein n=1 Tax=Clostridium sp. TaxID=1506 RepID=UPI003F336EAE
MENINKYLDNLYKMDNSKEALELKEEMRQHLLDSVEELKNDGLDEATAIKMAINRFGDNDSLRKDLNSFLNSHKKLSKKIRRYSIIGIIIGIVVMSFGVIKNNIDAGWGQFEFSKINNFDTQLPLESDENKYIEDMIHSKKLNKVAYFKLYKIEDEDVESQNNQSTLFDIRNDSELKGKVLKDAYSYGEPKDLYNQFATYRYNNEEASWYIEYELNHGVEYYLNICVAISYGIWFASLGGIILSFTIDKWRNKNISTQI